MTCIWLSHRWLLPIIFISIIWFLRNVSRSKIIWLVYLLLILFFTAVILNQGRYFRDWFLAFNIVPNIVGAWLVFDLLYFVFLWTVHLVRLWHHILLFLRVWRRWHMNVYLLIILNHTIVWRLLCIIVSISVNWCLLGFHGWFWLWNCIWQRELYMLIWLWDPYGLWNRRLLPWRFNNARKVIIEIIVQFTYSNFFYRSFGLQLIWHICWWLLNLEFLHFILLFVWRLW